MKDFLEKAARILEIPASDATPELEFRAVADWDSLKGFSLLMLLENSCGYAAIVEDLEASRTLGDLFSRATAR